MGGPARVEEGQFCPLTSAHRRANTVQAAPAGVLGWGGSGSSFQNVTRLGHRKQKSLGSPSLCEG